MNPRRAAWCHGLAISFAGCAMDVAGAQLPTTPCRVAGLEEQVRCATVEVPENRETAGGRRIPLRVVILPSRAPTAAPRLALFYLVGGPGLPATSLADLAAKAHATTRATHDIVLVDHRGTGGSNALECPLYGSSGDVATYLRDQFPADSIRTCARRLTGRADLTHYTSADAAQDLEDVRVRLGIDRIDLDASAYGTRVAMDYARRWPAHVRSLVLQAAVPDAEVVVLRAARHAQRALDRVFADCAADPFCRTSFPAPQRELQGLLARLDRGPLSIRVQHPRSPDSVTVVLTRGVFADRLRVMLHSTRLSRRIPAVLHHAHEGDWTPFVTLAYELSRVVFDQLAVGAHLSASCVEEMIAPADARSTFLGEYRARMYREACALWPVPSAASRPTMGQVRAPTLLVTGELDPVTPADYARRVAERMPNATVLTVPGMAHAGSERCVEELIARFVARGSMEGVDSSCVAGIRAPAFITR